MTKIEILDSHEFSNFVSNEFDKVVEHALVEDLAAFAFGSVDEAIKCFEKRILANR